MGGFGLSMFWLGFADVGRLEEKGNRVHVYISDYYNSRWEVPQSIIPRPKATDTITNSLMGTTAAAAADHKEIKHEKLLAVTYTTHPFGFAITRISNGEALFNSTPAAPADSSSSSSSSSSLSFNPMVFKDQYLEISTQLPVTASLFGLGESTRPDGLQLKQGRTYTLWTTDITAMDVNIDLYGAYPFYMDIREARAAADDDAAAGGQQLTHGVLLLNSNAMEVSYGAECLTFRVTGGVLDFYFFPGPSPLAVVDQYTQLVGRPAPMPYWSFGKPPSPPPPQLLHTKTRTKSPYPAAQLVLPSLVEGLGEVTLCIFHEAHEIKNKKIHLFLNIMI
jgi:alpha-glucosidase/alpha-D-xyloside xylohydrolase